jgi:hypothetical protein
MAKRIDLPFLASKYNKPFAKDVSVQNCVNCYLEEVPDMSGNTELIALGRPGTKLYTTVGDGTNPIRGCFQHHGFGYVVSSDDVYMLEEDGTPVALGTLAGSANRVSIAATNDNIVFADGEGDPRNYKVSTDTFSTISDADLPNNIKHVIAANEYVMFIEPDSGSVFVSAAGDPTSITATHFFSAEANYDNLRSGTYNKGLVYLFGQVTTEIWYNDGGDQGAPFTPYSDNVLPFGIAAEYAFATVLDNIFLLAQNEQGLIGIVQLSGGQYQIIQNRALIEEISGFVDYSTAYAWTRAENGHHFFCITFPNATANMGRTFCYDVTTGMWSELRMLNLSTPIGPLQDRFIASCSMLIGQQQIVGSWQSGKLYVLDTEVYQDFVNDGTAREIQMELIGPHLTNKGDFFSVTNIEVDVEGGVALEGDQLGSDPQIGLQVSRDQGHTWSGTKWRSMGEVGTYLKHIRWGSVGGGKSMTFKIIISDPVPRIILSMRAELA